MAKPKRAKEPVPPEAAILRAVVAELKRIGVVVERQNTGAAKYTDAKGGKRFVRFGTPGNLDLRGMLPPNGRVLEIEVKRPGNRPTALQYGRMNAINEAGGVAFWVDEPGLASKVIKCVREGKRVYIDRQGYVVITDEPYNREIEGWRG